MGDKKDKAAKLSGTQKIVSVKSERFDYTQWRKGLFKDRSSEEIISAAAEYEEAHPFQPKKSQLKINE
jgi:hypothetical protein